VGAVTGLRISMSTQHRLHAIVHGRVQGVGFRATTEYEAKKLGLGGWVRNRADGTVEVDAQGDRPHLETFLAFLQRGPLGAHVDAVDSEWLPAQSGAPFPFEVRRTT
jgi:acylphosphatase